MKLVVPEVGPALGRLIVPRRLAEPWVALDDVRETLATAVIECTGMARRDAADDAPARALDQLSRDALRGAWEEAVRQAAERVAAALDRELAQAARRVRMPRRRHQGLGVTAAERRALAARLASGSEEYLRALDAFDRSTDLLRLAWPGDPDTRREWQEGLLLAARRLEAAWLALEAQVDQERTRWAPELQAILSWRPSLWPIFAIWVPLAALAVWLGLTIGGYLPAPAWLAERLGF